MRPHPVMPSRTNLMRGAYGPVSRHRGAFALLEWSAFQIEYLTSIGYVRIVAGPRLRGHELLRRLAD